MFSVLCVFIHSRFPERLLPVLSCVYLALCSLNACVCGCLSLSLSLSVRARALRIVSRDEILRFKNTAIIIINYCLLSV